MAYKSGMNFIGREINYNLFDSLGNKLKKDIYTPYFKEHCNTCGSKIICNGCSNCGKCGK